MSEWLSKKLIPQIFSLANLSSEREKIDLYQFFFHQTLQIGLPYSLKR